jgi:predicted DNA-binding protein (UPF0251 family)/predicted Fe-Mo cluster-binding NifX family protein
MSKQRNHSTKPICFSYGPLTCKPKETLSLSADEFEAMVLADFKGLYQEECAEALGVSRPTFAKLIKRARKKMAEMVMYGKGISLVDEKRSFTVVFATNHRSQIHPYFLTAKQYAFARIENGSITTISYKANPIYRELIDKGIEVKDDADAAGMAAGRIIPPLLEGADILVVRTIGDGIRRNIEGMGINVELTDLGDIDDIIKHIF